jgi:hypothetical protein
MPRIYIPSPSEAHDRLPFSIPFFLKTIVGDRCRYDVPCKGMLDLTFTACETCVALEYDEDQMTESEYSVVAQYYEDQRHISGEKKSKLLLLRGSQIKANVHETMVNARDKLRF